MPNPKLSDDEAFARAVEAFEEEQAAMVRTHSVWKIGGELHLIPNQEPKEPTPPRMPQDAPTPPTGAWVPLSEAAALLSKELVALRKQVTRAAKGASAVTISGIEYRLHGRRWMANVAGWRR